MLHRRGDAFLRVLALAAICASHIRRRQPSTISDGPQSRSAVAPPLVHTNHTTTLQCHFTAAERAQRHRNWITRAPRDKTPSTPLPNICLYTYNICNVRDTLTIDKMAHHAFARQAREAHTHREITYSHAHPSYILINAHTREKSGARRNNGGHGAVIMVVVVVMEAIGDAMTGRVLCTYTIHMHTINAYPKMHMRGDGISRGV